MKFETTCAGVASEALRGINHGNQHKETNDGGEADLVLD